MVADPVLRPSTEDRIKAALWFAEHGFGVFSVWSTDPDGTCRCRDRGKCVSPGKHPIPVHGFKAATTDPTRIRAMLTAGSEPNWGMIPPDGVFIWDVDGEGIPRLAQLEDRLGSLPPTLRTNTVHGQHLFLRWPATLPRPIGQLFGYITRWGSGNDAGYVVGPRSVHSSGGVYTPADGTFKIADLPEAWATAAIASVPSVDNDDDDIITVGGYELPEPGYTGSRYYAIRDYTASRYMHGISKDEVLAGVLAVLAPRFAEALTDEDIRNRFERAWKRTPDRLGEPVGAAERIPAAVVLTNAIPEPPGSWPEPPDAAAYHGPVGEIVRLVASVTEADPVGILGTLLATVGACMGHFRYIYQGSAQATNLFLVLVGDSSSGRKGTAGSVAREIMSAAYPEWEDLIVAGLGSGEGLITHLKECEKKNEHRALVMESEFARLLTAMARDGSTLSPTVRDAWDGVPMGRFLARESALVKWHHVGIVAHCTPEDLQSRLTNTDAANGFGNRFLWLSVRRTRLVPFPESPRTLIPDALLAEIRDAIEAALRPGELRWSEDARDAWEDLYSAIAARDRVGLFGSLIARAEAQIVRLALLYALLDQAAVIEVAHLEAAQALWDYAERSVLHVFGDSTGNRDADALRAYLADGPMSWETAKKAIGARRAADLDEAVQLLSRLGLLVVVKAPKKQGGRPERWLRTPEQTLQTMQTTLEPA